MWNGLPVYKNNNGELLHHGTDGSWKVGKPLTWHGIRGFPAGLCPSEATKWTYDSDDKPADIIVKNLQNKYKSIIFIGLLNSLLTN